MKNRILLFLAVTLTAMCSAQTVVGSSVKITTQPPNNTSSDYILNWDPSTKKINSVSKADLFQGIPEISNFVKYADNSSDVDLHQNQLYAGELKLYDDKSDENTVISTDDRLLYINNLGSSASIRYDFNDGVLELISKNFPSTSFRYDSSNTNDTRLIFPVANGRVPTIYDESINDGYTDYTCPSYTEFNDFFQYLNTNKQNLLVDNVNIKTINGNSLLGSGNLTINNTAVTATQSGVVNNIPLQELGGVDKTINGVRIGRGRGDIITNTAVGGGALLYNDTGSENSAFGTSALRNNTVGSANCAYGYQALYANTAGGANNAFGYGSLQSNTTGNNNSSFGTNSLLSSTTGNYNSGFGKSSLQSNTTGNNNSSFGNESLQYNTTGVANSGFGSGALQYNTTGIANCGFGLNSLLSNTTGNYNYAFGNTSLINITTGSNNVGVGQSAGSGITTGSNNTYIGQGTGIGNTSNTMVLAAGSTNRIIVDSTGKTNLLNKLNISNLPTYADNTAATSGGLVAGDVYRTSTGILMIRY